MSGQDNGADLSWAEFERVQICVGTVVSASVFEKARKPAYILQVDFGPQIGTRKSSAQITHHYQPDELVGKQVVAVVNFPPKQIGPIRSECLVTGFFRDDGSVVLAVPDKPVANGARLG